MENAYKNHFKDCRPEVTLNKIKKIIFNMKLEVEEFWGVKSYIDTYSLRINIKDTSISANGKGETKEYAEASAYAELMERIQNMYLSAGWNYWIDNDLYLFSCFPDEKQLNINQLANTCSSLIHKYCDENKLNKLNIELIKESLFTIQKIDTKMYGLSKKILATPFYNINTGCIEYLPHTMCKYAYGSNGMSAGNTIEEAVIQALSEIFERIAIKEFMEKDKINSEKIPEKEIEKYPNIYQKYMKMKDKKNYYFTLLNCSFCSDIPVVAALIAEKNTGRYGVKFGCHPNWGIAMERALTEACQGQDIFNYAKTNKFDFVNKSDENFYNFSNICKNGQGDFAYSIFNFDIEKNDDYTGIKSEDNKEICKILLNKLVENGYTVYIRNVSFLGFPSIRIIIPGLSEMYTLANTYYQRIYEKMKIIDILKTPKDIGENNINMIISNMEHFAKSQVDNTIDSYFPWYEFGDLLGAFEGVGCGYFIALGYYYLKRYDKAAEQIDKLLLLKMEGAFYDLLHALGYLFKARKIGIKFEEAMSYIRVLFSDNIVTFIFSAFQDNEKVFIKQYPEFKESENNKVKDYNIVLSKIKKGMIKNLDYQYMDQQLRALLIISP